MTGITLFKKYNLRSSGITAISYSPDSMKLAVGTSDRLFQIIDINTGLPVFSKTLGSYVTSLKWSDFLLVLGCEDGTLSIWDIFVVKPIMKMQAHSGNIRFICQILTYENLLLIFKMFNC